MTVDFGRGRSDRISCKFLAISLDNAPDYYAIPYAWGNTEDTEEVLVNGLPSSAKRTLFTC